MQRGTNSFLRFVLGFSMFIIVSFGLTYAVSTYSIAEERKEQAAAAFQTMLGIHDTGGWTSLFK